MLNRENAGTTSELNKKDDSSYVGNHPVSQDTQPLPRIQDTQPINPPFPQEADTVSKRQKSRHPFIASRKAKIAIILIGFVSALLLGVFIESEIQSYEDAQKVASQQKADAERKEQDYQDKIKQLTEQRDMLIQKQKDFEAKAKELEKEKSYLDGKASTLQKESASTSTIGGLVDKISGKAAKRKEDAQEIERQSDTNDSQLQSIRDALADSKAAVDSIDKDIQKIQDMKEETEIFKQGIGDVGSGNFSGIIEKIINGTENILDLVVKLSNG